MPDFVNAHAVPLMAQNPGDATETTCKQEDKQPIGRDNSAVFRVPLISIISVIYANTQNPHCNFVALALASFEQSFIKIHSNETDMSLDA